MGLRCIKILRDRDEAIYLNRQLTSCGVYVLCEEHEGSFLIRVKPLDLETASNVIANSYSLFDRKTQDSEESEVG